jgi:hypothetical protein
MVKRLAEAEAHCLEHHNSEDLEARLVELLGQLASESCVVDGHV